MAFDVNKVCRICLEEGVLTPVFSSDFGTMPVDMIMHCTKIKVERNDGLPPHLCNNCIYRLGVAYHFKLQSETSDIRLRQFLGLDIKYNYKDATTNTEHNVLVKTDETTRKKVIIKKRLRKSTNYKRKADEEKLKRGPKPRPKEPQTCFECGKTFKCAAQLEMHIRTHTGERPFACSFCSKRFAQKHNLSIHIRTHTGEKPFQCEICSKQFSALGNFQSHKKIHMGIRDQVCPVCSKAFITSGDLSRHMATHTGIKNHHCDVCEKGFHRNRDLVSHKNRVHNIERNGSSASGTPSHLTRRPRPQPALPLQMPALPAPAARRPSIHVFRDEALTSHTPLIDAHVPLNY